MTGKHLTDTFFITQLSFLREKEMMTGKFWSLEQSKKGWVYEGRASMQMCMRAHVCVRAYVWICECVRVCAWVRVYVSKTVSECIRACV